MNCKKCGALVKENDIFCENCGELIEVEVLSKQVEEVKPCVKEKVDDVKIKDLIDLNNIKKEDVINATNVLANKAKAGAEIAKEKAIEVSGKTKEVIKIEAEKASNWYIVDLYRRLIAENNITTLIYLTLNLFIILFLIAPLFSDGSFLSFLFGVIIAIGLYSGSLCIALSPIGEWILRSNAGCKEIKNQEDLDFIMPLFEEVYAKAKEAEPLLRDDIKLYMNNDECPNAFATGRRTICLTKGLMLLPPDEIKATLAHEFGHLAHKDTDIILLVTVGNMIVTVIMTVIHFVADMIDDIAAIVSDVGGLAEVIMSVVKLVIHFAIAIFMYLWTKFGTVLVMKSSRNNEYRADRFAVSLDPTYGEGIIKLLSGLDEYKPEGLFATLASSHPDHASRINSIKEYQQKVQQGNVNYDL